MKKIYLLIFVIFLGIICIFAFKCFENTRKTKPSELYPSSILNLENWKLTLPKGKSKHPEEIKQPLLTKYSVDPFFKLNAEKNGVIFRAPVTGVTTDGSDYPRSELREMKNKGKALASWSTESGIHTMIIDQAITSVPKKKKHVVSGQIHDGENDVIVIRLEYPKLFIDINGKTGPILEENYSLGKRFDVKFEAENGKIKIYYNKNPDPVFTLEKKKTGCYFKAGVYTQSNCSNEDDCSEENYGEVTIYNLKTSHLE